MNLRPMEVRDNLAVAQLIRASLEEFGLDKPGTVYFDSHLDHLADYYQQQERAAYFVLEDEGQLVGCGGFAPVSDKITELQKLYVTKNSRGKGYSRSDCGFLRKEILSRSGNFSLLFKKYCSR